MMKTQLQAGTKLGTRGSVINAIFAIFLYGGLTYVTWGRAYWIPTIIFGSLFLLLLVGLPFEFTRAAEIEPSSPWASKEE